MTRSLYVKRLADLQDDVLVMASMVEKAVDRAVDALKRSDLDLARQVIRDDRLINQKRFEIEERAITIMATQAPVAADLRVMVAVLNVIVDLERMGDHAEGIAKIALMVGDTGPVKPLVDLPRMARVCCEMLRAAGSAFVAHDDAWAAEIMKRDDEVDALDDQVYRDLLAIMTSEPATIERATYLLWASHNLERIADRVTNICERVIFMRTGIMRQGLRELAAS
jgi:phosphate transport system protein